MANIVDAARQQVFKEHREGSDAFYWAVFFKSGKEQIGQLIVLGSENYRMDRPNGGPLYFNADAVEYLVPRLPGY